MPLRNVLSLVSVIVLPSLLAACPGDDGECRCPDDGLECTQEVCRNGACVHAVDIGFCAAEGKCVKDGEPRSKAGENCAFCNHAANPDGWTIVPTSCDKVDKCTLGATCSAESGLCEGGQPKPDNTPCTDDDNKCTRDVCKSGKCTHDAVPNDPVTVCEDDFNDCTDDRCLNGECKHLPNGLALFSDSFEGGTEGFAALWTKVGSTDEPAGTEGDLRPAPKPGGVGSDANALFWGEIAPPAPAKFDVPPNNPLSNAYVTAPFSMPDHATRFSLEIYHDTNDFNGNNLDDVKVFLVADGNQPGTCLGTVPDFKIVAQSSSEAVAQGWSNANVYTAISTSSNPGDVRAVYDKCANPVSHESDSLRCPAKASWSQHTFDVDAAWFKGRDVCLLLLVDSADEASPILEDSGVWIDKVAVSCAQ